jgi:putative ABC transport system permease protein
LRTALTATSVAISIAAAFSLLSFQHGYRRGLKRELDRLGAHVLVVPKGCPYEAASLALHGANWPCFLKASYLEELRTIPGVSIVAPVLMTARYGKDSRSTVYLGIDTNFLNLKHGWSIQGRFPGENEVLVGSATAKENAWSVGDPIPLPGLRDAKATVAGVLNPTHSTDDQFIYLSLTEAQRRFAHTNEFTHALIRLADTSQIDRVVKELRGCDAGMQMNVVPLAHLFQSINALAASTRWFLYSATLTALVAAAAGVAAALLIAVNERGREIGVMRALGASRADVFTMIWLESLQISLVGAAGGILVSFSFVWWIEDWLRRQLPFVPSGQLVTWEAWIAATSILVAIVVGSVAALAPAAKAAGIPPSDAMRRRSAYV